MADDMDDIEDLLEAPYKAEALNNIDKKIEVNFTFLLIFIFYFKFFMFYILLYLK
jgi:hypothetical protein